MQAHALLIADYAQAVEGKLYLIGGAWNSLSVGSFPTTHFIGVGVAIDVGWNETNQQQVAEITVEDADGNALKEPKIQIEFEAGRPPGHPVGTDIRLVFAVNGPVPIERPGSYSFVLKAGSQELARTRFQAVPRKP